MLREFHVPGVAARTDSVTDEIAAPPGHPFRFSAGQHDSEKGTRIGGQLFQKMSGKSKDSHIAGTPGLPLWSVFIRSGQQMSA
jgi:hypothetical protein